MLSHTVIAGCQNDGSIVVQNRRILTSGRWLKIAEIFDEAWIDEPPLEYPEAVVEILRDNAVDADLFMFSQSFDDLEPRHPGFHHEWDNIAAAPARDFKGWWESLPQESRKNVRRSQKKGVVVRPVEFDDTLVRGIKAI